MAFEHIKYNEKLIKTGLTFREFAEKSWKMPEFYYDNHYPCQIHGIGMCDEWPFIPYPDKGFTNGDYSGVHINWLICRKKLIPPHEELFSISSRMA